MDISRGIIRIDNELVVKPNFTFEQFKGTKFYTNQDGIRIRYFQDSKNKFEVFARTPLFLLFMQIDVLQ